jgi:class 3 adenylate cyclase
VSRPASVNFWNALTEAEREAFSSVAYERTFAGGATLMQEGEQADHVVVILSGWTKISVHEHGRERIVARRGPGQLIGERGALQVSVRSASVVALETVQALTVLTKDFAAFISNHPRVLKIVEGQVYDRLIEEPAGHRHHDEPGSFPVMPVGEKATTAWPHGSLGAYDTAQRPQRLLGGEHCTVLLTDVVAFGAHTRDDEDRRLIREALFSMTRAALRSVPGVRLEDRGDGLLIVAPPSVPTAKIITRLSGGLPGALNQHNITNPSSARIQLRVAVNVGPIVSDQMGISGEAIILASRLVEAPRFKKAMAKSGASLGIIASTFVYESVIRHSRSMAVYSQVQVNVKESRIPAWMTLIDNPVPLSAVRHLVVLDRQ